VKNIAWADVEHTETPGSYPFLNGTVDIAERRTTALFSCKSSDGNNETPKRYVLGSRE